jgi:ABC-type multidrug transport system ATPase subunit
MKIKISKLGPIRQAEFELGELTIICGQNNTGKTYATYALFGFLYFWRQAISINIPPNCIPQLLEDGTTKLDITSYQKDAAGILKKACARFTTSLSSHIFASSEKFFAESSFEVKISPEKINSANPFELNIGTSGTHLFAISKASHESDVLISLLIEKEKIKVPSGIIKRIIEDAIKEIVFKGFFPKPFIASAERTGAAIFRKELDFARNRLIEKLGSKKNIDPFEFLSKNYSDYALPVKENVDFTRRLEEISRQDSFIVKKHPELLEQFQDIIGGNYNVTNNDELYYIPKGKKVKLSINESSSAVRSLLEIGFYLRHIAEPGDLLMIDEPELNLHPENQRKIARLFARLINIGVKVFITTHSDYIIKELNTLIMLNQKTPRLQQIARNEGYKEEELLSHEKIRLYTAASTLIKLDGQSRKSKHITLIPAKIDAESGIEAETFDSTIDDMNRIQEEIVWGDDSAGE